jgi:large repetitive protein
MRLPWTACLRRLFRPARPVRRRPGFRPRLDALEERCVPTAYTVTTTKDLLNDTTPGELTLRDALTAIHNQAPSGNAAAGSASNAVTFAIGATGSTQTISLSGALGPLPTVNHQVLLDGWSQGGSGYSGPPLVVLNGAGAGANADGLVLVGGSDNSVVRGLVLQAFGFRSGFAGYSVVLRGTSGNLLEGDYLGTDSTGTQAVGNANGVRVEGGASNNTIGGTAAGARNVISGNSFNGIVLTDAGTTGNVVEGNFIGTDATGTAPLGNNGAEGVFVDGPGNTVGGTAAGAGNVISGNNGGVSTGLFGSGLLVEGNLIGTDITGTKPLGNRIGVDLFGMSNTVGGTAPGAGNLISANRVGVHISFTPPLTASSSFNVVAGNRIGTDASGTAPLGNTDFGVFLDFGATFNTVGGTTAAAANVIAGGVVGVLLANVENISQSTPPEVVGNVVEGNFIGTDAAGTADLRSANEGVAVGLNATGNTVGGAAAGAGNVITGAVYDVFLTDKGTSGNVVEGNFIGAHTAASPPPNQAGVFIASAATGNTVGGTAPGAANTISGIATGVGLAGGGTAGNVVEGNLVGTDQTGTAAVGNAVGVLLELGAAGNTVGGAAAGAGNVVSGNALGVVLAGPGTGHNVVEGNFIGTDAGGAAPLGNGVGVLLEQGASANTVGGTAAAAANVISANGYGVFLDGAGTAGNVVAGNFIGTGPAGSGALGNFFGVFLQNGASGNTVGGTTPDAANTVAHSSGQGVVVYGASTVGDSILGDSVFASGGVGIDLGGDGPTPNGPNPRSFPNDGQNFPVLSGAAGATVTGTLSSAPNVPYRLEFFGSPAGSAFQGQTLLGADLVTTDGGGNATFTTTLATPVPAGDVVTATATNLATGDTSEFS